MYEVLKDHKEVIDKAIKDIEKYVDVIKAHTEAARVCQHIIETFPDLTLNQFGVSIDTHALQGVLLFFNVRHFKVFIGVLREFGRLGWRQEGKPSDFPEIKRRHWTLRKGGTAGSVVLAGFLVEDREEEGSKGPICKYVVTGETTNKTYKLVCDDSEIEGVG